LHFGLFFCPMPLHVPVPDFLPKALSGRAVLVRR
jgi:hypothetical protein